MQLNISLLARPWFGIRYDSHQLLCGWMVEVNSEPFRIVGRDLVGVCLYMHPGSFGGSKMVRFDRLLASQSGCCSFDPSFLRALDT